MKQNLELWSLKEKRTYTEENALVTFNKGVAILCTPSGEPLVVKKR